MGTILINTAKKAILKLLITGKSCNYAGSWTRMLTGLTGADHFTIYTNSKSYCIPEINTVLHVNYISVKKSLKTITLISPVLIFIYLN